MSVARLLGLQRQDLGPAAKDMTGMTPLSGVSKAALAWGWLWNVESVLTSGSGEGGRATRLWIGREGD